MGRQFDDLAKALAAGVSRREALRRFAAGAVGGALAAVIPGRVSAEKGGNRNCAAICQAAFPEGPERDACVSASTKCPTGSCNLSGDECIPLDLLVRFECVKACRTAARGDRGAFTNCLVDSTGCPSGQCATFDLSVNHSVCVPA